MHLTRRSITAIKVIDLLQECISLFFKKKNWKQNIDSVRYQMFTFDIQLYYLEIRTLSNAITHEKWT